MSVQGVLHPIMEEMVGESPAIGELREQASRLAACDVNVVLTGESGTGKELFARIIHGLSRRRDGPFMGVNCAAIHETLLESELFGHEAGAFTGATHATVGFLRAADGGTILLDEVGDMSTPLQSKLLRVLEERAVIPVGGTTLIPIDVRILAATHRDLTRAVREGAFREDLYYRLNVVSVSLPPLRERRGDIPLLAGRILKEVADILGVPAKRLSPDARAALVEYDWPGNVRHLGNAIQYAYVLGSGPVITPADLPSEVCGEGKEPAQGFPTLHEAMRRHVQAALESAAGVRTQAARMLDIDRKRLRRIMRRFQLV